MGTGHPGLRCCHPPLSNGDTDLASKGISESGYSGWWGTELGEVQDSDTTVCHQWDPGRQAGQAQTQGV